MITLTAKINLLSGNNSELRLGSHNLSGNNISSDLNSVIGVKKNGSNPFIIGASKLGDGSTFSGGVDYFIGNQLSDKNGSFATPYEFEIKSTNSINSLTFSFDTINNRHPKNIIIYKKNEGTSDEIYNGRLETEFLGKINTVLSETEIQFFVNYEDILGIIKDKNPNIEIEELKLAHTIEGNSLSFTEPSGIENLTFSVKSGTTLTDEGVFGEITVSSDLEINSEILEKLVERNILITLYVGYSYKSISSGYEKIGKYQDDDPIFTITDLPNENSYKIEINNWNAPLYPLVITGIYAEVNIDIDYHNLISISRSIFDRSDLKLPSFGIISNTGNIEFNDTNGEVLDYAEQLLLQSGLNCEIKLNNTLVDGASQTIGLFETDQWNYDNDSRVVSVSLKDDLEEWQEINVQGIDYDPRKPQSKPFSGLYAYLWELTSNRYYATRGITGKGKYNMLAPDELDIDTQMVLENTYIQYPLLERGSLWQQWTKLCQACQLHIYKNNDGVIVCRYNGGN